MKLRGKNSCKPLNLVSRFGLSLEQIFPMRQSGLQKMMLSSKMVKSDQKIMMLLLLLQFKSLIGIGSSTLIIRRGGGTSFQKTRVKTQLNFYPRHFEACHLLFRHLYLISKHVTIASQKENCLFSPSSTF